MASRTVDTILDTALIELRRQAVRLACFEAALRSAAGSTARVNALFAVVVHFIEHGATGSHGSA